MFAKDIMKKCSVTCTRQTPLIALYQMMLDQDSDFIPVIEDNVHQNLIGIITERDICRQVIANGRNPRNLSAADVMNTEIIKIPASSSFTRCSQLLDGSKSQRLFVVDENGALCGVIAALDIKNTQTEQSPDALSRNAYLGEYRSTGINRIF